MLKRERVDARSGLPGRVLFLPDVQRIIQFSRYLRAECLNQTLLSRAPIPFQ
jgi:hypothetical protein